MLTRLFADPWDPRGRETSTEERVGLLLRVSFFTVPYSTIPCSTVYFTPGAKARLEGRNMENMFGGALLHLDYPSRHQPAVPHSCLVAGAVECSMLYEVFIYR